MGSSRPPRRLRVVFGRRAFGMDVERYAPGSDARRVAEAARAEFERRGVALEELRACEAEARDRTRLEGFVKVYLPLGEGEQRFGMVLGPGRAGDESVLVFVAFGVRHQPRGSRAPSVYELAHRRLHGGWP